MKNRYLLTLLLLGLAFWQASPSFAAEYDIMAVRDVASDCTTTITLTIDLHYTGVTADVGGPNRDIASIIIVDGTGQYLTGANAWIIVGSDVTVTNFVFITLFLFVDPEQRPFTILTYDVTAPAFNHDDAKLGILRDAYTFDPATFGACTSLPYGWGGDSEDGPTFTDGRINNWDTGNPVVLYGHDGETGRGLVVYSPEGELLLLVSAEQIAAVAECPAENTLIAEAGRVVIYRLSSCQYQLNAPSLDGTKTYVLIFNDLYENTGYSSHEE